MAKSRSYLVRRREIEQCLVKVKYFSLEEAWAAARALRKDRSRLSARPYRCPGLRGDPKHWHITGGQKW